MGFNSQQILSYLGKEYYKSQVFDLTLFKLGGHKFLLCCAKAACSRLIKLSDFYYHYIGYHLKRFSVASTQWRCHGNNFVNEHLGKIFKFSKEMGLFSVK